MKVGILKYNFFVTTLTSFDKSADENNRRERKGKNKKIKIKKVNKQ